MSNWKGGLLEWSDDGRSFISVVFSWQKQDAYQRAAWLRAEGNDVWVGGPAVYTDPWFFEEIAFVSPPLREGVLWRHNPDATFTTRGCIRECPFCIVPKIEPDYEELSGWVPRSIVCDNNILASSKRHFDDVIDKLKPLEDVDFNQGLDARLLTKDHAERLRELDMKVVRLAWDSIGLESQWMKAFEILRDVGFALDKIKTYVLIGFNDTPEDALYRLETVRSLGIRPNPMRYQPLDAVNRNDYVSSSWTERALKDYMRYWSRLRWFEHIPFADYIVGR